MATPAAVEGWSILARVTTVHRHTVTKYRSNATGLTVLHVDVPGTPADRPVRRCPRAAS